MCFFDKIDSQDIAGLLNGNSVDRRLLSEVNRGLDKAGIYYRSFARVKSPESLALKLNCKKIKYMEENRKLQDIVGVRIVLYFEDDVFLCKRIIEEMFEVHKEDSQIDKPRAFEFQPERLNLVCTLPEEYVRSFQNSIWKNYRIDKTFELQIRTIFSEGWHEVEHDVRYKHQKEWSTKNYYDFNRELNGIKAILEMCDKSIVHMIEDLTYYCYKNNKIEEMLRYKFRIHFDNEQLSVGLKEALNQQLTKELYRMERERVMMCISNNSLMDLPKTLDNLVFICNELQIHNEQLKKMTPRIVKDYVDEYLKKCER